MAYGDQKYIAIPEQFDLAADPGYLSAHKRLTEQLKEKVGRPDANPKGGYVGRDTEAKKEELFEQACEDTAREILLNEKTITQVAVDAVREIVNQRYQLFLADPRRAESSRGSAVH